MAFYRLFKGVDQHLAVLVVIFGGVMPAVLYIVNAVSDLGVLTILQKASTLTAFDKPQRDAISILLLDLHGDLNTAAAILWGVWLFPLAILAYRSRFLPRLLGVWLALGGLSWVAWCFTGVLFPEYRDRVSRGLPTRHARRDCAHSMARDQGCHANGVGNSVTLMWCSRRFASKWPSWSTSSRCNAWRRN